MNTQLVHSIIQVVRALPADEQRFVIDTLNHLFQTSTFQDQEQPTSEPSTQPMLLEAEPAWEIWHSLGDDAIAGKLDNTSTQHDRYLYSDT